MAQATLSCRFAAIHLEAALGKCPTEIPRKDDMQKIGVYRSDNVSAPWADSAAMRRKRLPLTRELSQNGLKNRFVTEGENKLRFTLC